MGKYMNRRGIDMSIQTIVMIIIALIVLFVIATFFTGGFKSLGLKFAGFHGAALNNTSGTGQGIGDYLNGSKVWQ